MCADAHVDVAATHAFDHRRPFAAQPVEAGQFGTGLQAQDLHVTRRARRQDESIAFAQRQIDVDAWWHGVDGSQRVLRMRRRTHSDTTRFTRRTDCHTKDLLTAA